MGLFLSEGPVKKELPASLIKARAYAFLLLKFRPRSEKELYERLKKKNFGEGVTKNTISFLKEKKFIDDEDFARAWIDWRLKRPLGLRRIEQELRQKGIDKEIIRAQIEVSRKDYREEDIVLKLAQERLGKLKDLQQKKAKQRILSYLLRRGFSTEIVIDTLNQL